VRKIFYKLIVENTSHGLGKETNFEFQYIPSFNKTTEDLGVYEDTGIKGGVERRNFVTFCMGTAVLGIAGYIGSRIAFGMLGGFRSWVIS
jgi:hypothetical protein